MLHVWLSKGLNNYPNLKGNILNGKFVCLYTYMYHLQFSNYQTVLKSRTIMPVATIIVIIVTFLGQFCPRGRKVQ